MVVLSARKTKSPDSRPPEMGWASRWPLALAGLQRSRFYCRLASAAAKVKKSRDGQILVVMLLFLAPAHIPLPCILWQDRDRESVYLTRVPGRRTLAVVMALLAIPVLPKLDRRLDASTETGAPFPLSMRWCRLATWTLSRHSALRP